MNVWIGREEVLSYCMQVEERQRVEDAKVKAGEEWILNNDIEKGHRQSGFGETGWGKSVAKTDPFDSRASRGEDRGEALVSGKEGRLLIKLTSNWGGLASSIEKRIGSGGNHTKKIIGW